MAVTVVNWSLKQSLAIVVLQHQRCLYVILQSTVLSLTLLQFFFACLLLLTTDMIVIMFFLNLISSLQAIQKSFPFADTV